MFPLFGELARGYAWIEGRRACDDFAQEGRHKELFVLLLKCCLTNIAVAAAVYRSNRSEFPAFQILMGRGHFFSTNAKESACGKICGA
jgi:hypothetical protein